MASYQDLIDRYRSIIQGLQTLMLRLVTIVPLTVTFFLFWLAMLQLLVLIKGWHWLRGGNAKPEPVTISAASPAPCRRRLSRSRLCRRPLARP